MAYERFEQLTENIH